MWLEIAFMCRFGHQDVHKILGIDGKRSLTPHERALFCAALREHLEAEFSPKTDTGAGTREAPQ